MPASGATAMTSVLTFDVLKYPISFRYVPFRGWG
jgi:hypothetical protein